MSTWIFTFTFIHLFKSGRLNFSLLKNSNQFNKNIFTFFFFSISVLPALAFENLNSLETLSIQNNKLTRIPEEVMEPIIDTLRVVDIMGK